MGEKKIQKNNEKIIVLFSGGQDSTTLLFWAKKYFGDVLALTINYGQRHIVELQQAKIIASKASVEHLLLNFDFYKIFTSTSSLVNENIPVEKQTTTPSLPNTFVPGRNYFFLGIAGVVAYENNIKNIAIGANQIDYSGYPDCRENFLIADEKALSFALDTKIKIHYPLLFMDKKQIWLLAKELNIIDIIIEDTHTCYEGNRTKKHSWGYGCGKCPACILRKKGFIQAFGEY